ncbi:MAG: GlsB/YeaQ/YmgE family stress response membrane protein [Actinomycetota bacterium]|nr:GlsB/YeaQ/YmgE family stress response membrane protein [Actinomycetota bacterium]
MLAFIVVLIVIGLVVGLIARLLVPGRDDIGLPGTILLGIVGSFVGGFLQQLIEFHHLEVTHFAATGFIGSIIGAIVLLLILRVTGLEKGRSRSRTRTSTRRRRRRI